MKYKIQWQDRWGKWQHYQTKTNEAEGKTKRHTTQDCG